MKQYYISFDDTDNLDSPGTGHVLQEFLDALPYETSFISRHQLFVHPEVPYTSHNSAMCAVVTGEVCEAELIARAQAYLRERLAEGADPGLCVAAADRLMRPEALVFWGYRAKKEVLTKEAAYALAKECRVHLSEHGGTGQGVVGALAAVGLRLGGQDGRVKGKREVSDLRLTVAELLTQTGFARVSAYGKGLLADTDVVFMTEPRVKAVYQNYVSTVLTVPEQGGYRLLSKDELKCY